MANFDGELRAEIDANVARSAASQPSIRFDTGRDVGEATLILQANEEPQKALDRWAAQLLELPAGTMRILDIIEVRGWGPPGDAQRYVKCAVKRQTQADLAIAAAVERACKTKRSRKPRPAVKNATLRGDEFWPIQDTQFGRKRDRLGGVEETRRRAEWLLTEGLPGWHDNLRRRGFAPDRIVIGLGGDLTEGCDTKANAAQNTHNLADQYELAVQTVDLAIEVASTLAPQVLVTGCSSNHDKQARRNSRDNVTDAWDDRTFQLLRQIGWGYRKAGRGEVVAMLPPDPDVWVVEGPLTVAGIHGHEPKMAGTPARSMWEWWEDEIANRRPAGAAQVLVSAHFHHGFSLGPQSGRWLIGQPSWDNGSDYWERRGGDFSLPGTTAFATSVEGLLAPETLVWPEDRRKVSEQIGTRVA
jgi:hypothetical protein